ncbi:MAG: tetratricopeptide repeat protein [bacterium]
MKPIIFKTALLAAAFSLSACSSAPEKKDDKVVTQAADDMGMKQEAVENFQIALNEFAKEKPDNAKALAGLERAVELEPLFAEAHYNLGILLMRLDQPAEAEAALLKAKEIDPDVLDYTVALARSYAVQGKTDLAEPLFLEVVAREPENLAAKNNLASLALKAGNTDKALEYLQDILRTDDENVAALTTLGLVYDKQNNLSLAKYMFTKAAKIDAKDPDAHNNLGLLYMKEQNLAAAVKEFQKAIEVDPNYLEARLNLGSILLQYLDYERANTQFAEAVRISPNHCVARLGNAASAFATADYGRAADNYSYYTEKCDPKHVSSYERPAKLYESQLKDNQKAIGYYETLLTLTQDAEKLTQYNAMINFLKSQSNQTQPKTPPADPAPEDGGEN